MLGIVGLCRGLNACTSAGRGRCRYFTNSQHRRYKIGIPQSPPFKHSYTRYQLLQCLLVGGHLIIRSFSWEETHLAGMVRAHNWQQCWHTMIEKKLKLFINGLLLNPVVLIKSSEIILYNMVEPGLMDESKIMRPTFSTLT